MKKCRGLLLYEEKANQDLQKLFTDVPDFFFKETKDLHTLPKNPNKPLTLRQMKQNGHILF